MLGSLEAEALAIQAAASEPVESILGLDLRERHSSYLEEDDLLSTAGRPRHDICFHNRCVALCT